MILTMVEELYTIISIIVPHPKNLDLKKNLKVLPEKQCHGLGGENTHKHDIPEIQWLIFRSSSGEASAP